MIKQFKIIYLVILLLNLIFEIIIYNFIILDDCEGDESKLNTLEGRLFHLYVYFLDILRHCYIIEFRSYIRLCSSKANESILYIICVSSTDM